MPDDDLSSLTSQTIDAAVREERRQGDRRERNQPKVACPKCQGWQSAVTNGRPDPRGYRRTRKCKDCGHEYKTIEKAA